MDYHQLKADVKEIAEIAASVPEQFREMLRDTTVESVAPRRGWRTHG